MGAGRAGLAAARRLTQAGRRVRVLEARARVGGRTHTLRLPVTGVGMDVGGQGVGPNQPHVMALLGELGLEVFSTYDAGQNLAHLLGHRLLYRGLIPPLPPHVLADDALLSARFEALARRIPKDAPWSAPDAAELDARTFGTWITRNAHTPQTSALMRLYAGAVFSADPAELSLLHALTYTAHGGGINPYPHPGERPARPRAGGRAEHHAADGGRSARRAPEQPSHACGARRSGRDPLHSRRPSPGTARHSRRAADPPGWRSVRPASATAARAAPAAAADGGCDQVPGRV